VFLLVPSLSHFYHFANLGGVLGLEWHWAYGEGQGLAMCFLGCLRSRDLVW
jgi:hypothetical protein